MVTNLYLHIPFCRRRCAYCSFVSVVVDKIPEEAYRQALEREFRQRKAAWPELGRPLETVYFGGGTPSLLAPEFYARFLDFLAAETGLAAGAEITLEANPIDLDREKITAYRAAGINRLSLGIQTFSDLGLNRLGRAHDAAGARAAIMAARRAGIDNLSLDLICAWPGQDRACLEEDLARVVAFSPEHLSVYLLTLEPDTPMGRQAARGELDLIDESGQAGMLELVAESLEDAGYLHYEVSNFARDPNFRSRHNLAGWRLADYLGLGAGACGSRRCRFGEEHWAERYTNLAAPGKYIELVGNGVSDSPAAPAGQVPVAPGFSWSETEIIDRKTSFNEALMLGLRLRAGVELEALQQEYGAEPVAAMLDKARPLVEAGLLEDSGGRLRISRRAVWLGDEITVALF